MAILPSVPGLSVKIYANHRPVTEYPDHDDAASSANTISVFIQAHSGQEFKISTKVFPKKFPYMADSIRSRVTIDGRVITRSVKDAVHMQACWEQGCSRYQTNGQWFARNFIFSQLNIVEQDASQKPDPALVKDLKDVGTITVELHRVKSIKTLSPGEFRLSKPVEKSFNEVPEKALKGRALTHSVSLSTPIATPFVETIDVEELSPTPFAVFNFKYRSLDSLKALRIIPRSPSPVPLGVRPIDELNLEEARQLARELLAQGARPKRERTPDIKPEPREFDFRIAVEDDEELSFMSTRSAKRRRIAEVEVVDLT